LIRIGIATAVPSASVGDWTAGNGASARSLIRRVKDEPFIRPFVLAVCSC
jgi:hypothetical protein